MSVEKPRAGKEKETNAERQMPKAVPKHPNLQIPKKSGTVTGGVACTGWNFNPSGFLAFGHWRL
jgi:hypothetical protein